MTDNKPVVFAPLEWLKIYSTALMQLDAELYDRALMSIDPHQPKGRGILDQLKEMYPNIYERKDGQ